MTTSLQINFPFRRNSIEGLIFCYDLAQCNSFTTPNDEAITFFFFFFFLRNVMIVFFFYSSWLSAYLRQ